MIWLLLQGAVLAGPLADVAQGQPAPTELAAAASEGAGGPAGTPHDHRDCPFCQPGGHGGPPPPAVTGRLPAARAGPVQGAAVSAGRRARPSGPVGARAPPLL